MNHTWVLWKDRNYKFGSDARGRNVFFRCDRCGCIQKMDYALPDETLKAIGVPECDEYLIQSVMEA